MDSENGRKSYRAIEIISGLGGIVAVPVVSFGEVALIRWRGHSKYEDNFFDAGNPLEREELNRSERERSRKYGWKRTFKRRCARNYRANLRKIMGN